jgi:hypothetical protein
VASRCEIQAGVVSCIHDKSLLDHILGESGDCGEGHRNWEHTTHSHIASWTLEHDAF